MTNFGSPPADLDSACAQIGISSAPSPASPRDLSEVAAETNPPFHGTEGDQTESDDLVRLLGPELMAPLVIRKVLEKRKKLEELEKEAAQNEADLRVGERFLDKWVPRASWDPRVKAMKIPPAPASPAADLSDDSARPAQEPPPSNDPSEPALLENSGQRSPSHAPPVNPETTEVVRKTDHVEPPTDTVDGPQRARIRWAIEGIRNWRKEGTRALTQKINKRLDSEDGRNAGRHIGRPVSVDTVWRFLKSAGEAP